ncbi:MAG: hypothetical protein AABZ31_11350 [Bdellovibrionota bacterium]
MKKFIVIFILPILLTGCLKEAEIKNEIAIFTAKKEAALRVLSNQDYSLEGLLTAQDYFFVFSERVHMMKADPQGLAGIKKMLSKQGVASFCETYAIPLTLWTKLETFCTNGPFYKCSPEIKEYRNTLAKMKELLTSDKNNKFDLTNSCN